MTAAFTTIPAARASNPVHRSVPGWPRVVRKPCRAPCRSERSGPARSGRRSEPPEGRRPRRGARIHARARTARRPCHQGDLSIRRRSQASAIVRGCRDTAFPVGLLRRVLFLIGTRRQRVVSWQFDVPAQNWIASPPIHGSGVGVQPSAGWGRMADSRGADSVDELVTATRSRAQTGRAGTFRHGGIPARRLPGMRPPVPDARQPGRRRVDLPLPDLRASLCAGERAVGGRRSAVVDLADAGSRTPDPPTADSPTADPPTAPCHTAAFRMAASPAARSGVSSRRLAAPHPSTSR